MIEARLEEIDTGAVSFPDIAEHFSLHPQMALLETRGGAGYSFLAFRPFLMGGFDVVEQALNTWHLQDGPRKGEPPFLGGGIGYFSYDFGRQIERIPTRAVDELGMSDCQFAFYNAVLIRSRDDGRVYLSSFDPGVAGAITREEVLAELRKVAPQP
jgi:anthranilate/para-aminobenzoate synthase component I